MVALMELWLPILLSAVIVFVASSIIHMVLGYHKGNYRKRPNEERLSTPSRAFFFFPCTARELNAQRRGPNAFEKGRRPD